MYKVIYKLPGHIIRTLIMSSDEFKAWVSHRYLRTRIVCWERVG